LSLVQTPDGSTSLVVAPGGGGTTNVADGSVLVGPAFSNANTPEDLGDISAHMSIYAGEPVGGGLEIDASNPKSRREVFIATAGEEVSLGKPTIAGQAPWPVGFH